MIQVFKSREKYLKLSLNFISIDSLSHKSYQSSQYQVQASKKRVVVFFMLSKLLVEIFGLYHALKKTAFADNQ